MGRGVASGAICLPMSHKKDVRLIYEIIYMYLYMLKGTLNVLQPQRQLLVTDMETLKLHCTRKHEPDIPSKAQFRRHRNKLDFP